MRCRIRGEASSWILNKKDSLGIEIKEGQIKSNAYNLNFICYTNDMYEITIELKKYKIESDYQY